MSYILSSEHLNIPLGWASTSRTFTDHCLETDLEKIMIHSGEVLNLILGSRIMFHSTIKENDTFFYFQL